MLSPTGVSPSLHLTRFVTPLAWRFCQKAYTQPILRVQLNILIMDTLGPGILSFIGKVVVSSENMNVNVLDLKVCPLSRPFFFFSFFRTVPPEVLVYCCTVLHDPGCGSFCTHVHNNILNALTLCIPYYAMLSLHSGSLGERSGMRRDMLSGDLQGYYDVILTT